MSEKRFLNVSKMLLIFLRLSSGGWRGKEGGFSSELLQKDKQLRRCEIRKTDIYVLNARPSQELEQQLAQNAAYQEMIAQTRHPLLREMTGLYIDI